MTETREPPLFLRYFIYIVMAAVVSAVLGGGFATLVALISPEFVADFFPRSGAANTTRFAAAIGMVWGLFLGTAVMAFSLRRTNIHRIIEAFRSRA